MSVDNRRAVTAAWIKFERENAEGYDTFRVQDIQWGFMEGYAAALADIAAQTVTQVPNDAVFRDGRWEMP